MNILIKQRIYTPGTIMYQQLPTSTDPVPSSINQYHSILTQYHQVSTSTKLYCCCLGLQTSAQFTPGLVSSLVHLWPCQIWMIHTISFPLQFSSHQSKFGSAIFDESIAFSDPLHSPSVGVEWFIVACLNFIHTKFFQPEQPQRN